jgi:hypothetical protein
MLYGIISKEQDESRLEEILWSGRSNNKDQQHNYIEHSPHLNWQNIQACNYKFGFISYQI